jgi:hypothetical protein
VSQTRQNDGANGQSPVPSSEIPIRLKLIDEWFRTGRLFLKLAASICLAWVAKEAVVALAGHTTSVLVQMGLQIFADLRVVFSVALAGSCAAWAIVERKIRQKSLEQMHKRVKELELAIDPHRSSSTLTTKGKTNPRDRSV